MLQSTKYQHINTESQMARSIVGYKKPKKGEFILRDGWYWPESKCAKKHDSPRNQFKQCVQCVREYRSKKGHFTKNAKEWRDKNKPLLNRIRRNYNSSNQEATMLSAAKSSAKNKKIPFNLDDSDIKIPETCSVLGIALKRGNGKRTGASPSLDRIIPEKGYTKGNVIVISWRANKIKCDATAKELQLIADFYTNIASKN